MKGSGRGNQNKPDQSRVIVYNLPFNPSQNLAQPTSNASVLNLPAASLALLRIERVSSSD